MDANPSEAFDFARAAFLQSAPNLAACPPDVGAEVAFAGRSNAGKSSALNALARRGGLARVGKSPGVTRLINFFRLDEAGALRLVDLPGYGYARVSRAELRAWGRELHHYLAGRRSLRALVLFADCRLPLQEGDWQLLRWCAAAALPVRVVLTKADKLGRGAALAACRARVRELAAAGCEAAGVQIFSAPKQWGVAELSEFLAARLAAPTVVESPS